MVIEFQPPPCPFHEGWNTMAIVFKQGFALVRTKNFQLKHAWSSSFGATL